MSVRSLWASFVASIAFVVSFLIAPSVLANACSFACQVNLIPPPLTGSLSSCTSDVECTRFCATVCSQLGTTVRAVVDNSRPSICGTSTPRSCSPCSCTPQVALTCEGSDAGVCTTSCNNTCAAYARPAGVQSIGCRTTPGPECLVPQRAASGSTGFCQYACNLGTERTVRTDRRCTQASPSECAGALSASTCAGVNLATSSRAPECISTDGTDANARCVITCSRTAVNDAQAGTCTPNGAPAVSTERCLNGCQATCGARGMRCNTDSVQCSGSGASGTCRYSCSPQPTPQVRDDRATVCSFSNDASLTAATTLCTNRCNAYCGELGATCASTPAPTCNGTGGAAGTPGNVTPPTTGNTATNRPSSPSRTAPTLRVNFPDPFEGRLTIQEIIGSIIRILVGLCGVFFLGVFVYGGLLYLTSGGNPKQVDTGRKAIVNAVIGLVIVLFAYIGVSLIVQVSDQLQTGDIAEPDTSLNAQDEDPSALRPGGTTQATGRSSQGSSPSAGSGAIPLPEPGTPGAACRSFYGADPANCTAIGGTCPRGVSDLGGLVTTWGTSFPAPSPELPDPAAACRSCLESGIRGMGGRYPGIDTSCIPALVNLWSTSCRDTCNPRMMAAPRPTSVTSVCDVSGYDTAEPSCARCITYWSQPSRAATIASVGCSEAAGKVAVWCATAEAPSQTRRPQSGGYCRPVSTR